MGDSTKGRASTFKVFQLCNVTSLFMTSNGGKHPDPQWRARLNEIQRDNLARLDDPGDSRNGFAVNHPLSKQLKGQNRSIVPLVETFNATEVRLRINSTEL